MSRLRTRLIVMPLLVAVVAGGIAVWSNRKQARQTAEVQARVVALCRDLAEGRDPSAHLAGTDPFLARELLERLGPLAQESARADHVVEVVVSAGDAPPRGTVPGAATHSAVIRGAARDALVLRLVHTGRDDGGIVIIGFWVP